MAECECRNLWGHPWGGQGTQVIDASCPVHGGLRLNPPLDVKGILWLAALALVPIEERVEWVERLAAQVDEINAMRRGE